MTYIYILAWTVTSYNAFMNKSFTTYLSAYKTADSCLDRLDVKVKKDPNGEGKCMKTPLEK